VSDVARLGLDIVAQGPFTPAALARDFLARRNLVPLLIVHPDLREDFAGLAADGGEAVVIAMRAPSSPTALESSLSEDPPWRRVSRPAKNRNFLDHDNELSLDAGPSSRGSNTLRVRPRQCSASRARFFKLAVESRLAARGCRDDW